MEKESQKRKYRKGELTALYFDKLPQRCKEMFFEYLNPFSPAKSKNKCNLIEVMSLDYEFCESPIEIIFDFAYEVMMFDRIDEVPQLYIEHQFPIYTEKHTYRADFYFDTEYEFKYHYMYENDFKLIIECDGHNFHEKTKEQVKHNNERDYDLKNAGFDVLHFSGHQIYTEPFKCANKTIDYILSKIGKWEVLE